MSETNGVVDGGTLRDEAIDAAGFAEWAEGEGNPRLVDAYEEAIGRVVRSLGTFTTDDVWIELRGMALVDGDPRAMGAAMRRAMLKGQCTPTGRYRVSTRPRCHRRPVREWQSLAPDAGRGPVERAVLKEIAKLGGSQ